MTVVIIMHKTSFIFMTCVMSWLWRCHVSLMHTPSSKVLPKLFSHDEKKTRRQWSINDNYIAVQTISTCNFNDEIRRDQNVFKKNKNFTKTLFLFLSKKETKCYCGLLYTPLLQELSWVQFPDIIGSNHQIRALLLQGSILICLF